MYNSCQSSEATIAEAKVYAWCRMLWKGFCNVMQEMQMPLDSSLEFEDAADVIGTACSELGVSVGAVGFQIHIDGAEVHQSQGVGYLAPSRSFKL